MSKPRVADLFSGVGMNSVAFRQAGCEPVFASDICPVAREVYRDNLGLVPAGDLALVNPRAVPDHDVCVASPPCQPQSDAGMRKGLEDGRSDVLYPLFRFLAHKRPRAVVVENVAPMARRGNPAFRLVRNVLRGLGYRLSWEVLRASDFGAAQNRARLFVVGSLGTPFDFGRLEKRTPGRIIDFLDPAMDQGWLDPAGYELLATPQVLPSGVLYAGFRRAARRVPDGDLRCPRTHYEYNWVYASGGVGPTLTTSTNTLFLAEVLGRVRRVTLDECRRLMGLPDDFRLGDRGVDETMRLLGNGVYVPLVAELTRQVVVQLLRNQARRPGTNAGQHADQRRAEENVNNLPDQEWSGSGPATVRQPRAGP